MKIRALWWRFPTLKGEESSYFYVPGQFPPKKVTLAELAQKKSVWERPGILQLAENRTAVFFMDYRDPTLDRGCTEVIRKGENGIQVTQVFNIMGRMKSGTVQELGTTWMWVLPTDGESALSEIHRGMVALGHTVPEGRPAEFQNMLLYSFHPGGSIGSNMQDLGGFASAVPFVDRISATGANAVWMLPLESNGIYWPNDYYRFQDGLGTGDEYRALVKRMHDCGIYVMQDCVPHGGSNTYDRAKQHPEWLVYDEDGSTFNYWCFDFNWPTWREYMKNVAKYYMETYGVDGYRIDAVSGSKVPNWNPEIPYARASFAKLQAGFNMQKSIREGVKEVSPTRGGTLAEVGEDCFGLVSDAIYDFSGCYQVFQASRGMSAKEYVPALRRWLYECRLGGPKGMLRMRHSESHDSLRSQLWYGTTQARAIVALTAFIDGIPLLYQGQEVGNLETYAKIFSVRKALPEMQNVAYDYLGVEVPDGVFAVGYEKDGLRSVGLINFNSLPVRFNLAVSATEAENTPEKVTDMFRGKTLTVKDGSAPVFLPPFGFTVYALREVTFMPPTLTAKGEPKTVSENNAENKAENVTENVLEHVLTGSNWKARISTQSGLLLSLTQNGVELLGPARLVVDGENAENHAENNAENVEFLAEESSDMKLVFRRTVAGQSFTLTYWTENDALQFSASLMPKNSKDVTPLLKELSVEFPCPNADMWGANTAEGVLRDRIFFRTDKKIDVYARHGIYWRPLELETLYDSYYQSLWRNAFLKAEWAENTVTFSFRENAIPARVRWLNRCGEEKTLTASLSLIGPLTASVAPEVTVAIMAKNRPYFGGGTLNFRDLRMTKVKESPESASRKRFIILPEMGGWRVENEAYSLRLTRFGTIQELVSKKNSEKKVLENASLYTDYGFGAQKDRFCAENEVETWSRFETLPDGALRLHFEGRLRKKDRFGRCPKPVSFVIEYTLDGSDSFTMNTRIDAPSVKETDSAFLSWMIATPTADSFTYRRAGETVAEGKPLEVQGRSWQSKVAGIMPDEMVLASQGTPILRIHSFDGDAVTNVFQDRKNLFFSFYDGKIATNAKTSQVYEWKMTVY